jgi:hypothetical protein
MNILARRGPSRAEGKISGRSSPPTTDPVPSVTSILVRDAAKQDRKIVPANSVGRFWLATDTTVTDEKPRVSGLFLIR